MSDQGASSIPPQTFVECGLCKRNATISWFCKNCPTSLCDACATSHEKIKQYKSHTVVQRTYTVLRLFGPAKIAEQCQIHPEKDISSYCNECDVPCCISCLVKNHQRHEISTIEDKYLDAEKRLNDYARHLDNDVKPTLDKMEDEIKGDEKEENDLEEKVVNDINEFRKDVIQDFNMSCDNLIKDAKNVTSKSTEALKEVENSKKAIETLKKQIDESIAKGKIDIIKYQPPDLESLMPTLKSPRKLVPIFEPEMKVLDVIKKSVGRIKLKEMNKNEGAFNNILTASLHVQKLCSFRGKLEVNSMTTAGKNMAWIINEDASTMYLYNEKGEVVRSVKVKSRKGINAMAITQSGEMIVTCDDKKVRCVSVTGEVSTLIHTAPCWCNGIYVNDEQEIVVCMSVVQRNSHVAVYSPDGRTKLREMRGRSVEGGNLISYPYRVVKNDNDLFLVNRGTNVVCVDERDNVKWVYDGEQAELENDFNPTGICVDKYNNLLVTDRNNSCVHYVNRDGGLIQVILTEEQTGLIGHLGICVDDSTGHVWLGNSLKDIVIARYVK